MTSSSVCKQISILGLFGIGSFGLVFFVLDYWYGNPLIHPIQSILSEGCPSEITDNIEEVDKFNEIQQVIDVCRKMVRDDMMSYHYPNETYNASATKLQDLGMVENGIPTRSIILSYFRSGSSFFSDIIKSHPGNFYQFEPLVDFGTVKVRGPPLAANAIERLKALLNCEYTQDGYMEIAETGEWIFNKTTYLWEQCEAYNGVCYDHRYLSKLCKLFPYQTMKIVRLRLSVAQEILADEKLAARLVLLVRDPRGMLRSRQNSGHRWCPLGPDCLEAALVCADLVSDYKTAVELQNKYPTRFRVLRYEDLAADPYKQAEELLDFYGRKFHPNVKEFLDTHTKIDSSDVYSTSRNSKTAPVRWRTELRFEEVAEIQRTCSDAMKYWGYVSAMNATHQREFNPVTDYALSL